MDDAQDPPREETLPPELVTTPPPGHPGRGLRPGLPERGLRPGHPERGLRPGQAALDPQGETAPLAPAPPTDPLLVAETALEPAPDPARSGTQGGASSPGEGPPPRAATGSQQVGEFELLHELARGGMGVVWVARSRRLGRRVALKLLKGDEVGPEARERFQIEARAAARLRHPHIVGVHEVGEADGAPYLAMDLIEGESLQARLRRERRLPAREAARIAALLARALAYAHAHAVLHRDVKPGNVLLDPEGQPVLTDFGLAKELEAPSGGPTRTGQLMGTPAYMPPEQVRGELDQVDRRADVWSLGALLYQALTGEVPFPASSTAAVLVKILHHEPVAPRQLRPDLDRDLETIVLRCLEKEPSARYGSAQALAEDLERWLADRPISARRPGVGERLRKWARRNRALTGSLLGLAALTLVLGGAGGALHLRRLEEERRRADERAEVALEALTVLIETVQDELRLVQDPRARSMRQRLLESALQGVERLRRLEQSGTQDQARALLRGVQAGRLSAELEQELGRRERARAALDQAERRARALVAAHPDWRAARRELSLALDLMGGMHRLAGEVTAARRAWEESLALAEALLREQPHELTARRDVATGLIQLARLESDDGAAARALALAEEAVRRRRDLAAATGMGLEELADALLHRSHARQAGGDGPGALRDACEALALIRLALLRGPSRLRTHHLFAALNQVGRAWSAMQEPAPGRLVHTEARLLAEALLRADPGSDALKEDLAALLSAEASLTGGAEGAALGQRSVALWRELLARDPGEREPRRRLSEALTALAQVELERDESQDAAARAAREAVALARQVLAGEADPALEAELAEALDAQGRAELARGQAGPAAAALEEALALRRRLAASPRASDQVRRGLLLSLQHLSELRAATGELGQAAALLEEAVSASSAGTSGSGLDRALLLCKLANLHRVGDDLPRARARYHEALPLLRATAREVPAWRAQLEGLERHVGMLDLAAGDAAGVPATPAAHLARAYALALRGEVAAAHPHFQAALREEGLRADLTLAHLRCAAEAALAAGEREAALDRLREDLRRRQAALVVLERELPGVADPGRRANLEDRASSLRAPLEALPYDPTYATLRDEPGFQALLRAAGDR